jgi:hypothetical protein
LDLHDADDDGGVNDNTGGCYSGITVRIISEITRVNEWVLMNPSDVSGVCYILQLMNVAINRKLDVFGNRENAQVNGGGTDKPRTLPPHPSKLSNEAIDLSSLVKTAIDKIRVYKNSGVAAAGLHDYLKGLVYYSNVVRYDTGLLGVAEGCGYDCGVSSSDSNSNGVLYYDTLPLKCKYWLLNKFIHDGLNGCWKGMDGERIRVLEGMREGVVERLVGGGGEEERREGAGDEGGASDTNSTANSTANSTTHSTTHSSSSSTSSAHSNSSEFWSKIKYDNVDKVHTVTDVGDDNAHFMNVEGRKLINGCEEVDALRIIFDDYCELLQTTLGDDKYYTTLELYNQKRGTDVDTESSILNVIDKLDAIHLKPSGMLERLKNGFNAVCFGVATLVGNME